MDGGRGMNGEGKSGAELFAQREQRYYDAVHLKETDRVPTILYSTFWVARYAGMTCREAMYDYDRLAAATKRALIELEPDVYVPPHPMYALGPVMDMIDYKQIQWPGHNGLAKDVSFQYLDSEYMKADEYDDFLFDPTGFYLHKYLPRLAGAFSPLAELPDFSSIYYTRVLHSLAAFARPDVRNALETMMKAGEEMQKSFASLAALVKEMAGHGFPTAYAASGHAPFDLLTDYMRGSKGGMLDMLRRPVKLVDAMEKAAVLIPRNMIATAKRQNGKGVFIPLHWGLDGFMSPKQFSTFFWPSLRKVLMTLIEAGLYPTVLWEGDCTSRLETIADIPPGKCIYFFERTDIFKAKEVLGKVACLRGNVPVSMMITGTPDDVRAYCRKLIEVVGRDGGFIMDSAVGIPDEAKPENVRAMFDSVRQFSS